MTDALLRRRLEAVAARSRRLRVLRVSLTMWCALCLVLGIMLLAGATRNHLLLVLGGGACAAVLASLIAGRQRERDHLDAAHLIEGQYPDLDSRLLTAIGQAPDSETRRLNFLQSQVVSEVLDHSRQVSWRDSVPGKKLGAFQSGRLLAMVVCLILAVVGLLRPVAPPQLAEDASEEGSHGAVSSEMEIVVEPGDTELERGTSLLVMARFPQQIPDEVSLVAIDDLGQELRIPLRKSLDDPLYGGRIPEVQRDLKYRVEFNQQASDTFSVTTFDYPALVRADADIEFPEYTGLSPESMTDVRRVSLVEGAQLTLNCELNKPVDEAVLIDEDGEQFPLEGSDESENLFTINWSPEIDDGKRYRLELRDPDGRANREPPEFIVQVLPNNPPDLKVAFPGKDARVSPIEEVSLQASAQDDYGMMEYGLVYQSPDGSEQSLVLGEGAARDEEKTLGHMLALESLDVHPNELISYYFYAEDVGPDGTKRRSFSDMFFAEVRPFEEIFRQVPSQPGQGQQQQQEGGQTQRLIELQKQIVTAAWNVIRREIRESVSSRFGEDVATLAESQTEVRGLAEQMAEMVEDPLMKEFAVEALDAMAQAEEEFSAALDQSSADPLPLGRSAAQAAYQALLKLQSREKQVQNSQSQSSSQSQSQARQRMDRQLNELELKNDRNRYETERQAQQAQEQAERETLQVLNRLRELARRQEDLNDKIRELENQLRNAQTEQQRDEIERRLKRLEEEQEELLRSLDELRERMNTEENRSQMADAREQVDRTRERVMRASEALKEQQLSRALTEGTRAERDLENLEEDFRKQTSGQFDDAIRELRDEVQELAERENELAESLRQDSAASEPERRTLRDTSENNNRDELADRLAEQRSHLGSALDSAQELVREAETSEPLLSKKLYDALRDLRKYQPEQSLENASRLMRFGIQEEAQRLEEQARKGINRLQKGVDEAAQSVLGDEAKALAMARDALDDLTEAIEGELERNDPSFQAEEAGEPSRSGQPPSDRQSPAEPADGRAAPSDSDQKTDQQTDQQDGSAQSESQQQTGRPREGDPSQPGRGQRPSEDAQQSEGPSQSPQQPGQQREQSGQQGQSPEPSDAQQQQSPGQQQGEQQGQGQGQGQQQQGQAQQGGGQSDQPGENRGPQQSDPNQSRIGSLLQQMGGTQDGGGGNFGPHMPLTGGDFLEWSDRMRDIEEVLPTPELRSQAAAIRDRARQVRVDVKRHSKQPDWELVRMKIYGPLLELQQLVSEELARKNPNEKLVPVDRDPVPDKYSKLVREYYEQLSRQR